MIFNPTSLAGAYVVELEQRQDARGSFARAFCAREFEAQGLARSFVQANLSTNVAKGTIRGMHYQLAPHAEVKLVRCVRGSLYDVIVDLREGSPTYLQWFGAELSEDNGLMMYVPAGFAHGLQALTDGATAYYLVDAFYAPGAEGGCRYDDPAIGVSWPLPVGAISEKDAAWPRL
jgi:dTDP-4-dehydrorhamnose 3,5-epimerase